MCVLKYAVDREKYVSKENSSIKQKPTDVQLIILANYEWKVI